MSENVKFLNFCSLMLFFSHSSFGEDLSIRYTCYFDFTVCCTVRFFNKLRDEDILVKNFIPLTFTVKKHKL